MRRLMPRPAPEADLRPAVLSVWISLLLLMLPFLLLTSSPQKLTAVALSLSGSGPAPSGAHRLTDVRVEVRAGAAWVSAQVRRTDVLAQGGDSEVRTVEVAAAADGQPDFVALGAVLADLHAVDPTQRRAVVVPDDAARTADVLRLLDLVRGVGGETLFPEVEMGL